MKVLKFGGTSVGSPESIERVISILETNVKDESFLAAVFSAFGDVTDLLIEMCRLAAAGDESYRRLFSRLEKRHIETADALLSLQKRSHVLTRIKIMMKNIEEVAYGIFLVKELTKKTLDFIMSFGERLSAYIIHSCLEDRNIVNRLIDTRGVIITDNTFGSARVHIDPSEKNIRQTFSAENTLYIATGFIASTENRETTTLGRGGSDFTASLLAAALGAEEVEIWTDVDGVMTADPRKVKEAFSIPQMTYEEAMELSHFGAKVLHPPTMQPALKAGIPIRIRNTFNPAFEGTVIRSEAGGNGGLIRGISSIDSIALLQIQGIGMVGFTGIAGRIFSALAEEKINVILISQASSEHSICLAVTPDSAQRAKRAIEKKLHFEIRYGQVNEVIIEKDMAIIAVVGERMRHTIGIAGRVFQTLGENEINISAIAQGSSELNISMVIAKKDEKKALNVLHKAFFTPPAQ
ncbi:MAG TPA: aspartate kinase [Caldithrix abyssi]|uniref:Aspartokinase n=1 Tax=Caldithrix abyssi TaxID=187145 RepID=A0A7V4U3J4_CALAY|nr:aspartate kinase [Caldithrix abyssi]